MLCYSIQLHATLISHILYSSLYALYSLLYGLYSLLYALEYIKSLSPQCLLITLYVLLRASSELSRYTVRSNDDGSLTASNGTYSNRVMYYGVVCFMT